jgi:hypothetical protein
MNKEEKKCYNKEWKEIKRQSCEVYTRVMWYIRPISHANIGKKSEFYSRKNFKEWCMCKREFDMIQANQDFISKYSNETTD